MQTLTANNAKTQLGELLMKAQRGPAVQIDKNGKPVAVMVSVEEYDRMEALKLQLLKFKAIKAENDISNGHTFYGELFFDELEAGKYD